MTHCLTGTDYPDFPSTRGPVARTATFGSTKRTYFEPDQPAFGDQLNTGEFRLFGVQAIRDHGGPTCTVERAERVYDYLFAHNKIRVFTWKGYHACMTAVPRAHPCTQPTRVLFT
jgi:hypothetical protein